MFKHEAKLKEGPVSAAGAIRKLRPHASGCGGWPLAGPNRRGCARSANLAGLVMLVAVGGCASLQPRAPAPEPAFAAPARWSASLADGKPMATEHGASLAGWWRRFQDPLLERLLEQALRANTSIAGARAALTQARAARDAAAAVLAATVNGTATARSSKTNGLATSNSASAGFDASWDPDLFGAHRYGLEAGEAALRASAVSLDDVQVTVAAELARTYIELRGTQARLAIARDNLASQQQTLQITSWRVQAGLLTSLEEQQAITAAEQAAAQLPALETGLAQLTHALAVLCAQAPAELDVTLAAPAPIPEAGADLALSLPAATLRQRADVRAAEYQLSAARARVGQADAARYPAFQLQGSLGLSWLSPAGHGADLLRALLAAVTGNIFDGGASRAQLLLQRGALAQAQASYRNAVLTALQEVEDALAALAGDRQRLLHLRTAAGAAATAALLARQRYASGLVDFQTVLETQRALYASEDGVASTRTDQSADLVRLYKALGGGWQADGDGAAALGAAGTPATLSGAGRL
jgi:NodT family efflux transporter outer membrane factor (OMF) lipoprotein